MTTTLKMSEDDLESELDIAIAILKGGGVIIYPTDTVYGIGGDATSEEVVRKVCQIKKIDGTRPFSVMVSGFEMIEQYCETGTWEDIILKKYLPGPYTFILKKKTGIAAANGDKLGVRIPDSVFCQKLCQKFGKPIITTSANITKDRPATKFEDVDKNVVDAVALAIDSGPTKYQSPSIVIDLVERKMLREGAKESINLIELTEG